MLMTRHYPDLGSASDWSCRVGNLIEPIRSTTQIWVVTRHQYGISALVSQTSFPSTLVFQTSFGGETSGSVPKCRLFSQVKFLLAKCFKKSLLFNFQVLTVIQSMGLWLCPSGLLQGAKFSRARVKNCRSRGRRYTKGTWKSTHDKFGVWTWPYLLKSRWVKFRLSKRFSLSLSAPKSLIS